MPIPWEDDPAFLPTIAANVKNLAPILFGQARQRLKPSLSMAQDWHRAIYAGVPVPVPYFVGEFRDSDPRFPELIDYNVGVGSLTGTLAPAVPADLSGFERAVQAASAILDRSIPAGQRPADTSQLAAVVRFAAYAHGEWVRIHPFANGNGRTARTWANFVVLRYGLPAFISIKPRPSSGLYALAAQRSMLGDHRFTELVFLDLMNATAP